MPCDARDKVFGGMATARRYHRRPDQRFQWWPVSFRWRRHACLRWIDWHGVESTPLTRAASWPIGLRSFRQVWHLGPLKIVLGVAREEYREVADG